MKYFVRALQWWSDAIMGRRSNRIMAFTGLALAAIYGTMALVHYLR